MMGGNRRVRVGFVAALLILAAVGTACGSSSPSASNTSTPQAANIAAVPSETSSSSTTTTTSGGGSTGSQTLAVHIYLCQEYSNNGINDLETSTTEISNGTVSISGVTTTAQANPYSTTVSPGTYTVSATAPPGFYFTSCPSAAVTPTITNGAQSASGSVNVAELGVSAAFYVVAFQTATCSAVSGGVTCLLPSTLGLPFFPMSTLLAEANGVSNSVSSSTPLVITAWGGNGGSGDADPGSAYHGGPGGQAGKAQTSLTSVANYEATNKTTVLFYYLGHQGVNGGQDGDTVGGFGGSATIVSPDNFATGTVAPCINGYDNCTSTTNVLLIAGGGGGGGQGGLGFSGAHGGTGGSAIATTTSGNLFVASGNGNQAGGNGGGAGFGGSGNGGHCTGGAGGGSGHYANGLGGDAGNSGIGGTGGPMKKNSSGDSTGAIPWANAGYLGLIGTAGSGGRGVWGGDGFEDGGGGTGGGGCGGGGSAGSGGSTGAGGGAGAGGCFAAQAQVSTGSFTAPSHSSGVNNGQVYVTFVLS